MILRWLWIAYALCGVWFSVCAVGGLPWGAFGALYCGYMAGVERMTIPEQSE